MIVMPGRRPAGCRGRAIHYADVPPADIVSSRAGANRGLYLCINPIVIGLGDNTPGAQRLHANKTAKKIGGSDAKSMERQGRARDIFLGLL